MALKKKINYIIILIIGGIILFTLSMLTFIINACTISNVPLAWVMLGLIFIGSGMLLVGLILMLFKNKDKIKDYIEKIIN